MKQTGTISFSATHLNGGQKSVPPPPLGSSRTGSEGPNCWVLWAAELQYITWMASGGASSEIAQISLANCSSSSFPIEPEVSTAIAISPNPSRSTEGKYRPEAM